MATTPGISWILLPNGICFPLENQRFIEVQGVNLVLTDYSGGSRSIPLGTNAIANSVLAAIELVMATPVSFTAIPPFISSISPVGFNSLNDTITIFGYGFSGGGTIWVEEAPAGMDCNGVNMSVTVINDNEMTAKFNGFGDTWVYDGGGASSVTISAGVAYTAAKGANDIQWSLDNITFSAVWPAVIPDTNIQTTLYLKGTASQTVTADVMETISGNRVAPASYVGAMLIAFKNAGGTLSNNINATQDNAYNITIP